MGWDEDAPDAGGVEELRRQVEALWLENAVMGETIRVLKADDPRLDPSMLTNWSRTRIIDAIRGEFGLARALQATGLEARHLLLRAWRDRRGRTSDKGLRTFSWR